MKVRFGLLFALLVVTADFGIAGSAAWNLNPTSNDWHTAANWTPETVPNQNTDIASFNASNITEISVAIEFGFGLDSMVFNPSASAYTFAVSQSSYIGFAGAGVINNSGVTENFDCLNNMGFGNNSTAGNDVIYTNKRAGSNAWIQFSNSSNAGSATFINEGDSPDFGSGDIFFRDTSSAASSSIINEQGELGGGNTSFTDSSTAADSTITTQTGSILEFYGLATAGNATLIADGGTIYFEQSSNGGLARVELTNGGILNIVHETGAFMVSIGSLEGDRGTVQLGSRQLTIGGNGLSTTFGGVVGGNPGALIKTGNETLTLTGANTYVGLTTVSGGTLLAAAATGSATGAGPVHVDAGTFGGIGNVTGGVTVGTGTGTRAFLAPGVNGTGTLSIASFLIFNSDGSYKCDLAATLHPRVDQVSANGVTIVRGARFMLRTKGNETIPLGTIFTVISNTATTPISGVFSNLRDGSTITAGSNTLQVSYEGGDGNDLTLTVVP